MNSKLKNLFLGTTLVLVLASIVVTFYQISNLDDDEELFQKVYEEQLDGILYSINQYSQDIVNSWKSDLAESFSETKSTKSLIIDDHDFLFKTKEIVYAFRQIKKSEYQIFLESTRYENELNAKIDSVVNANQSLINKLFEYFDQGYKKIEPIKDPFRNGVLLLMVDVVNSKKTLIGIAINELRFMQLNLFARIQELYTNKFELGVISPYKIEYSEIDFVNDENHKISKDIWILPGFKLFIKLKDDNIATLVSSKLRMNLFILISLSGLIILSSVFLFITFRKEMKLAQMKTDFISNVSHELRTPLALISMYSETLELGRIKDEVKRQEYYSVISGEAERLGKIVNNILNFSKMEAGKRKYNFIHSDLSDLVTHILSTYTFHLEKSGFNLVFNNSVSEAKLNCDTEALSEAVINLIDNAVKYSKEKKEIVVSLYQNKERYFLSIKDFGIGIPSKDINKIFDKFYRVSTGLRHNTKGTGIGLSIVKHIVEAHNGFINVKSKENAGSEFIIELPINEGNYDV